MSGFRFSALNPWSREGCAVWLALTRAGFPPESVGAGVSKATGYAFIMLHSLSAGPAYTVALGTLIEVSSEKFVGQWKEGCLAIHQKQAGDVEIESFFRESLVFKNLDEMMLGLMKRGIKPPC